MRLTQRTHSVSSSRRGSLILSLMVVIGLAGVASISRWIELRQPNAKSRVEDEALYVNATTLRRMSLGFNGLVADWYWMRSLQYVGRKVIERRDAGQLDDLESLDLRALYLLLDTTTTLDPQFMAPYEFGAVLLPAINESDHAVELLKKGITANTGAWQLYHNLGYIYWKRGDYKTASETYAAGALLPNAPHWLGPMSARMLVDGGSRQLARDMYQRLFDESDDSKIREMAARRILQIQSLDERDVIRRVMKDFAERNKRCVSSWREIALALRAARVRIDTSGAPIDPSDMPYVLKDGGCDVELDGRSIVPFK